ncbi:MAG: hypothetical protein J6386_17745 [Candidatus Synoicihabitans palmerolidicus]|nr:hypothetical protein [Candidatus Synoicihabitans palmerolidicus]
MAHLSLEAAQRARQRDYSETLVEDLPHDTWVSLRPEFVEKGLECRHGGRFHTVTGAGTDKGKAVAEVLVLYERAYGRPVQSIGLGDSANDTPLLCAVTQPFLVAREDGSWANLKIKGMEPIDGRGPYGWVEAVDLLLSQADESTGAGAA